MKKRKKNDEKSGMLIKENLDRSSQHLAMILVSKKNHHKTHKYFLSLHILFLTTFQPLAMLQA